MSSPARSRRAAAAAVIALLLIGLAVPLWPSSAGGSTGYAVTRGASMQPRFSDGDLALLRRPSSYRVGDVAAYRSATLHRAVVHRITAINGDTFTFKGDANSFLDPEQVQRSAVLGRVAVRIPKVGAMLLWLAHPFNALLLTLLIALVIATRGRLVELLTGKAAVAEAPAAQPISEPARLDSDRVVRIRDMSFPHELAVADVVDADSILRLAERYDRPVMYDEAEDLLFVVESSMLFRCANATGRAETTLSVVRDLVPSPQVPEVPEVPEVIAPIAQAPQPEAPYKWAKLPRGERPRTPAARGRDWDYTGHTSAG